MKTSSMWWKTCDVDFCCYAGPCNLSGQHSENDSVETRKEPRIWRNFTSKYKRKKTLNAEFCGVASCECWSALHFILSLGMWYSNDSCSVSTSSAKICEQNSIDNQLICFSVEPCKDSCWFMFWRFRLNKVIAQSCKTWFFLLLDYAVYTIPWRIWNLLLFLMVMWTVPLLRNRFSFVCNMRQEAWCCSFEYRWNT